MKFIKKYWKDLLLIVVGLIVILLLLNFNKPKTQNAAEFTPANIPQNAGIGAFNIAPVFLENWALPKAENWALPENVNPELRLNLYNIPVENCPYCSGNNLGYDYKWN